MRNDRINPDMSISEAILALSEDDANAMSTLVGLVNAAERVNPGSAEGPWSILRQLDTQGIYGEKIHKLHNGLAARDAETTYALLRARQLELPGAPDLNEELSKFRITPADKNAVIALVREIEPGFAPDYTLKASRADDAEALVPRVAGMKF